MINGRQRRLRAAPHAPARRGPTLRWFRQLPRDGAGAGLRRKSPEPLPGHEIRLSGMLHRPSDGDSSLARIRFADARRDAGLAGQRRELARSNRPIGAAAAAFAERCGFEPKAGRMQFLPGEAGALAGVLFGVDEAKRAGARSVRRRQARDIAARRRLPVRQPARGRRSRRARLPARALSL